MKTHCLLAAADAAVVVDDDDDDYCLDCWSWGTMNAGNRAI